MSKELCFMEESRSNYVSTTGSISTDQLQTGCLMRIANSVEMIAKDRETLEKDCKRWEKWYRDQLVVSDRLQRANNAYRGIIRRMKK